MTSDPAAPVTVRSQRTMKLAVRANANAAKRNAVVRTVGLYQRVVNFYAELFLDHSTLVNGHSAKEALAKAERMTVPAGNRKPLRDMTELFGDFPRDLRRAAINAAYGAVKSHLSQLTTYEVLPAGQKRHKRQPVFGLPGSYPVMYAQMAKVDENFYRDGFVRLKLLDDAGSWGWVNLPVVGRPGVGSLVREALVEKARQREARRLAVEAARREGRMDDKGRPAFTAEEKTAMRLAVGAFEICSPTLVVNRRGVSVNVPVERAVSVVRAEPGRKAGAHRRVVTVDTNTHNVTAVAWDGGKVLAVHKFSYSSIAASREKAVGTAIRKARQSRHRAKGQRHCVALWEHISNQGETAARQAAAWLATFAVRHEATVIVFEHLRQYRPERGTRSRRANRKRSYWLRGKIRRYTSDKAIEKGVLTVERNAAWTSAACPRCHRLGERFSLSVTNPANRARFECGACGWSGDADVVAAMNLKAKWDRDFSYPTKDEQAVWKKRQRQAEPKTGWRRPAAKPANRCKGRRLLAMPVVKVAA